jgi:hypothetical protein
MWTVLLSLFPTQKYGGIHEFVIWILVCWSAGSKKISSQAWIMKHPIQQKNTKKGVDKRTGKTAWRTATTRGFSGGWRRCRRRAGTSFDQLAEALFLGKQIPACTCSPTKKLLGGLVQACTGPVTACRRITPQRVGTCLYQLGEELILGQRVQAAHRGQRRGPPVKPRIGGVLPDFFTNAQKKHEKWPYEYYALL